MSKRLYSCRELTMCASDWCDHLGVSWSTLYQAAMDLGSVDEAIDVLWQVMEQMSDEDLVDF